LRRFVDLPQSAWAISPADASFYRGLTILPPCNSRSAHGIDVPVSLSRFEQRFKEQAMNHASFSLKAIAVAVTLAASSLANAASYDIGTVSPGTSLSDRISVPRLGVFEDFYTFSLLTP